MESKWCKISEEFVSPLSIIEKLRLLKAFLKVWNHESFGSIELHIEVTMDLLNDLEDWDGGMEEQGELVDTRCQSQGNLWRLLKYRSSIWRQNSWVLWLQERDWNIRFFQEAAKIRDMHNFICGLQVNGHWVSSPMLPKRYVSRFCLLPFYSISCGRIFLINCVIGEVERGFSS
ncbi:hypothetical protein V6N13_097720 [Hibiscus sabdariffa]